MIDDRPGTCGNGAVVEQFFKIFFWFLARSPPLASIEPFHFFHFLG